MFREEEVSSSNIKEILMFSQKKGFLVFRETETPKKFLVIRKPTIFIIQETETLKTFYISESNFPSSKNELKKPL